MASDYTAVRFPTLHTNNVNTVGLKTLAKIGLSDVDNSRGYEMTVTGSGFNNGTTAGVFVLHIPGTEGGGRCRRRLRLSPDRNMYIWNKYGRAMRSN